MIKYIYGFILCASVGSSALGMQEFPDQGVQVITSQDLQTRWEKAQKARDDFHKKHGDTWRTNSLLKKEKDNLDAACRNLEYEVLAAALIPGNAGLKIKKHARENSAPIIDNSTNNNDNRTDTAQAGRELTFEEIFERAVVKKTKKSKD